jgi:hypothetical protein
MVVTEKPGALETDFRAASQMMISTFPDGKRFE